MTTQDIKPSTLLVKDINNWFMTESKKGETNFFFYTKLTKTGKMSGIFITLIQEEGFSRIYSKRRAFNFNKLIPAKVFLSNKKLTDEYITDYLDDLLTICCKNGQKSGLL